MGKSNAMLESHAISVKLPSTPSSRVDSKTGTGSTVKPSQLLTHDKWNQLATDLDSEADAGSD